MLIQEQIMSILLNVLVVYAVICTVLCTIFFIGLVKHLRKAFKTEETVNNIKQSIKLVYVEKVNNINYLYDGITHTFITQAESEEQMWLNAKLRFPNKEFIIRGDDDKAVLVSVKDKI